MRNFRELKVWEKSHDLTLAVYKRTATFPKEGLYGLTSQMRRSSSSIPTNIAEGCGRGSSKDMAHFLQMATGSASELEYQLLLAKDLRYLSCPECEELSAQVTEIKRMLTSLIQKLRC